LAGFAKDAPGTEAALKYYLMGALLGTTMLAGVAVLYGAGRATAYSALGTVLPVVYTAGTASLILGIAGGAILPLTHGALLS
jgi:NADH-quinone oxidoreductase subunit N